MKRKISFLRKMALKYAIKRKEDFQEFAGLRLRKFPGDCLATHSLLYRCRPQVVVEMGSAHGASALLMASYAEHVGIEDIISVDIGEGDRPSDPRINFITGDSSRPDIVEKIHEQVGARSCTLILDSNHHAHHVTKELELYLSLVQKGQALILEDTLVDVCDFKKFREEGGPLRAFDEFVKKNPKYEFEQAEGIEPYVTTNFFGYMIRK